MNFQDFIKDVIPLFNSVLLMFLMIIPGFLMRKTKLADGSLAKGFSNTILYATQPALIIGSFIREYDPQIMQRAAAVFLFSFIAHLLFYIIARQCFKKAPEAHRRVLQFALIFSNAGYMGIPLIQAWLGSEYVMYSSVYCIWFNVFTWSLGALIYTEDKKHISLKSVLVNPASIPTYIGVLIFVLSLSRYIPGPVTQVMTALGNTVAPLAMMMIGLRLAEVRFKSVFTDRRLMPYLALRHFLLPFAVWAIMRLLMLAGVGFVDMDVMKVVLVSAATPAAAATGIFAERFGGDGAYASKIVAVSTIVSVITIPMVALLLAI